MQAGKPESAMLCTVRSMHLPNSLGAAQIVKPITASCGCSYAELLPPKSPTIFASHNWKSEFRVFFKTILRHAQETFGKKYLDVAYWICSFAVNQHAPEITSELPDGTPDLDSSPFNVALSSTSCERLLFVMDLVELPLQRLWCLYELVRAKERNMPIDFATPDAVINKQASLSEEGERTIAALQVCEDRKVVALLGEDLRGSC